MLRMKYCFVVDLALWNHGVKTDPNKQINENCVVMNNFLQNIAGDIVSSS